MYWYLEGLRKYAVFGSRSTRREFWYFNLFNNSVGIVIVVLGDFISTWTDQVGILVLLALVAITLIPPGIAVSVRRLHDINYSGWWLSVALVPVIGAILLLVLFARPSHEGVNKHGSAQAVTRPTQMFEGTPLDAGALTLLTLAVIVASFLYVVSWSGAITRSSSLFGPVFWLRAHVVLYVMANFIGLAVFGLSLWFAMIAASTRFPWLETALLVMGLLLVGGIYTGANFAARVWGNVPWSDPKLLISIATTAYTLVVVCPLAAWMRLNEPARQRHLTLASLLLVVGTLAAYAFAYPHRTMHPLGSIFAP